MNPETGEVVREPVTAPAAKRFDWRDVSATVIEAVYIESHNGDARAARRRMQRDLAKGRCSRDVIEILRGRLEAVPA